MAPSPKSFAGSSLSSGILDRPPGARHHPKSKYRSSPLSGRNDNLSVPAYELAQRKLRLKENLERRRQTSSDGHVLPDAPHAAPDGSSARAEDNAQDGPGMMTPTPNVPPMALPPGLGEALPQFPRDGTSHAHHIPEAGQDEEEADNGETKETDDESTDDEESEDEESEDEESEDDESEDDESEDEESEDEESEDEESEDEEPEDEESEDEEDEDTDDDGDASENESDKLRLPSSLPKTFSTGNYRRLIPNRLYRRELGIIHAQSETMALIDPGKVAVVEPSKLLHVLAHNSLTGEEKDQLEVIQNLRRQLTNEPGHSPESQLRMKEAILIPFHWDGNIILGYIQRLHTNVFIHILCPSKTWVDDQHGRSIHDKQNPTIHVYSFINSVFPELDRTNVRAYRAEITAQPSFDLDPRLLDGATNEDIPQFYNVLPMFAEVLLSIVNIQSPAFEKLPRLNPAVLERLFGAFNLHTPNENQALASARTRYADQVYFIVLGPFIPDPIRAPNFRWIRYKNEVRDTMRKKQKIELHNQVHKVNKEARRVRLQQVIAESREAARLVQSHQEDLEEVVNALYTQLDRTKTDLHFSHLNLEGFNGDFNPDDPMEPWVIPGLAVEQRLQALDEDVKNQREVIQKAMSTVPFAARLFASGIHGKEALRALKRHLNR